MLQYLNSYIIARQNTGHYNRYKLSLSAVTNILYTRVPGRSKGVRKIIKAVRGRLMQYCKAKGNKMLWFWQVDLPSFRSR
jgi:hypothetical protein